MNNRIKQAYLVAECASRAIEQLKFDESFEKAIFYFTHLAGKVITTGMGKAGIVAQKAASTFSSLGIPSAFLHPADALHGDSGILTPQDILLALSTSGKTREVLEVIDVARDLGVLGIIAITSHLDGDMRKRSDIVLDMGIIPEADTLGLAPTTSIIVMLTICDALALVTAKENGFTRGDFALRHHGGYLGKAAQR